MLMNQSSTDSVEIPKETSLVRKIFELLKEIQGMQFRVMRHCIQKCFSTLFTDLQPENDTLLSPFARESFAAKCSILLSVKLFLARKRS